MALVPVSHSTSHGSSAPSDLPNFGVTDQKPFSQIQDKTYLNDHTEKDVFKFLLHTLRPRAYDQKTVYNRAIDGSIYQPGMKSSELAMRNFLIKARNKDMLPSWFDEAKIEECIQQGLGGQAQYHPSFSGPLHEELTTYDTDYVLVTSKYNNDGAIVVKMRAFAEKVYGCAVSGQVLDRMVKLEEGTGSG